MWSRVIETDLVTWLSKVHIFPFHFPPFAHIGKKGEEIVIPNLALTPIYEKTSGRGGEDPAHRRSVRRLWKARNRAEGLFGPRQISKTTNRSDKRQTGFDISLKDLQFLYKFDLGRSHCIPIDASWPGGQFGTIYKSLAPSSRDLLPKNYWWLRMTSDDPFRCLCQ